MDIKQLKIGENAPQEFNAVVEIPKGSQNKYEYDEKMDVIKLDRVLHSPLFYPTDYGFIPETRSDDGDHLDVLIMATTTFFPGAVVKVRPIALLKMIDKGEKDLKILAVVVDDPRLSHLHSLKDINNHFYMEVSHFFSEYKRLEKKEVLVKGWEEKKAALEEIKKSHKRYKKEELG